jgi:hypothetical protein
VLSEASTTNPVVRVTLCFVDVALLIVVSAADMMNGVPWPSPKLMFERDVRL